MIDRQVIKKKVALGIIVLFLASRKYAVTDQRGSYLRKINDCRIKKEECHSLVQDLRSEDSDGSNAVSVFRQGIIPNNRKFFDSVN